MVRFFATRRKKRGGGWVELIFFVLTCCNFCKVVRTPEVFFVFFIQKLVKDDLGRVGASNDDWKREVVFWSHDIWLWHVLLLMMVMMMMMMMMMLTIDKCMLHWMLIWFDVSSVLAEHLKHLVVHHYHICFWCVTQRLKAEMQHVEMSCCPHLASNVLCALHVFTVLASNCNLPCLHEVYMTTCMTPCWCIYDRVPAGQDEDSMLYSPVPHQSPGWIDLQLDIVDPTW